MDGEKYILFGGAGDGNDDFSIAADEMIRLADKESPEYLFIGFAQLEPHHGFEYYGTLFAQKGCKTSLMTYDDISKAEAAKKKIDSADIIFIMGGDTRKLIDTLNRYGVSYMLRAAAKKGTVMSGFSAGEICLCRAGMSKDGEYYLQDGIGCLDFLCCPHPLTSKKRYERFLCEMSAFPGAVGVAFDGAGLEIANGRYRSLVFCPDGYMSKIVRTEKGETVFEEVGEDWRPIRLLTGVI